MYNYYINNATRLGITKMKNVTRNLTTDTIAILHHLAERERDVYKDNMLRGCYDGDVNRMEQVYARIVELDMAIDELCGLV